MPLYVGKTVKQSFAKECFTDRNYRILTEAMEDQMGTLVLFLLRYEKSRGPFNGRVTALLEEFLVEAGLEKNERLANTVYARKIPGFAIDGVHRAPNQRGAPARGARELKRALGL